MKQFGYILVIVFVFVTAFPHFSAQAASSGDLIKGGPSAVYYVTADGKRLAFPNETTYFSWYADFSKVKIVSDQAVAALPLAGLVTLRPGLYPVKVQSDNTTYAIALGGVLRAIGSDDLVAMIYGNDWKNKVVVIPDAFFVSYKSGDAITAAGQYWWKQEMDKAPDIAHDMIEQGAAPAIKSFTVTPKTDAHKTINLAVGLWNPHDPAIKATPPTKAAITQILFGNSLADKSVNGFYNQMTGGSVELKEAGVFGWYDANKPASHYWATPDPTDGDHDGYINGHNEKWAETIFKMDKEFDFSQYDTNHDGTLTPDELGVLIVIPTDSPFGTNRVVYTQEFPSDQPMIVDGVKIGMIAEWYTGSPANFGVVAHELSHLFFNTVDMYVDSVYRASGLSLMDGTYCNCDIDPWQRLADGKNWLNILSPNGSGDYELSPIGSSTSVVKIPIAGSDEFYLIEYRGHDLYNDVSVPGLLVWDIKTSAIDGDWGRNDIRLLRASSGNDSLASYHGTTSHPATTGILTRFDGTSSGISIADIGPADATIKFKLNLPQ